MDKDSYTQNQPESAKNRGKKAKTKQTTSTSSSPTSSSSTSAPSTQAPSTPASSDTKHESSGHESSSNATSPAPTSSPAAQETIKAAENGSNTALAVLALNANPTNTANPTEKTPDTSNPKCEPLTGPNANPCPTGSAPQSATAQSTDTAKTLTNETSKVTAKVPPAPLTKADKASLICALALSLLWSICVSPIISSGYFALTGGLALSVCLLAFFGCAWFLRRKPETKQAEKTNVLKGAKRLNPQMPKSSYALLFCTVVLMLVPAFSEAEWIRLINACALAIVLPLTFLLLSGADNSELFRLSGILRSIGTFLAEQFCHWSVLVRVATSWVLGRGRAVGSIAVGAVCAAAVLVIVIPALSSADGNFAWIVDNLFAGLTDFDFGPRLLDIIRFVVIIPLAFSLLFGLRHPHKKAASDTSVTHYQASTATLNTMLTMLDVVYLVFVAIQSSYLFGGVDTLKRFGGYAAYARAGFFQLVGVTAINLVIVMVCTYLHKHQKRAISLLLLELVLVTSTLVMLVSAAWRMSLYVEKYGLTRLRLLTYWGMVAIAFLLAATVIKLLRPHFALFRVAFFGTLALWLVFAFIQPDAIIANVDVDGYLNGSIEEVGTLYLGELPASATDPLNRLMQQAPDKSTRDAAASALHKVHDNANETMWSLWGI